MNALTGFNDVCGTQLMKNNYVNNIFLKVAYNYGFEEIRVPILEPSSTFEEKIIGKSPWPEWNEKSLFQFSIVNYKKDYNTIYSQQNVLLVPEGTVSVTRWLGNKINQSKNIKFPVCIFYSMTCFRNELIDTISSTKKREFNQFGFEILGAKSISSDYKIISIIFDCLLSLDLKTEDIKVRVNDVSIFNMLCEESKISNSKKIILKELLDYYAECKAGKHVNDKVQTASKIYNFLNECDLEEKKFNKWKTIVECDGTIEEDVINLFGSKYIKKFQRLKQLQNDFYKSKKNIYIDLCVIRSHEYYTGISFEVDVVKYGKKFIEIAGGGRFDRLVSNFIQEKTVIPCTGFAFGIERIIMMLDELEMFKGEKEIKIKYCFQQSSQV